MSEPASIAIVALAAVALAAAVAVLVRHRTRGLAAALLREMQRRHAAEALALRGERDGLQSELQRMVAEVDALRAACEEVRSDRSELRARADTALAVQRAAGAAARSHAEQAQSGLERLARVDQAFERWHQGLDELLRHNREMHDKNAGFNRIVMQMTIVTLNASIEAARAGAAGAGFAVVAGEMRELTRRAMALSADYKQALNENDLLTASTFQDLQAGGKMIANAVVNIGLANRKSVEALAEPASAQA